MNLKPFIISILKPLGVPVSGHDYKGSDETYITLFEYNQNGALHADDQEIKTSYFFQVDIWSSGDFTQLVEDARQAMLNAGFIRNFETEVFEKETETYHKVFRFQFVQ